MLKVRIDSVLVLFTREGERNRYGSISRFYFFPKEILSDPQFQLLNVTPKIRIATLNLTIFFPNTATIRWSSKPLVNKTVLHISV